MNKVALFYYSITPVNCVLYGFIVDPLLEVFSREDVFTCHAVKYRTCALPQSRAYHWCTLLPPDSALRVVTAPVSTAPKLANGAVSVSKDSIRQPELAVLLLFQTF